MNRLASVNLLVLLCCASFANAQSSVEDALFQSSVTSLSQKQFAVADSGFKTLQELESPNPRGLMGRLQVRMAAKDVEGAIRLLQDELAKDPSNALLYMAMGDIAARAGRFDLALAQYQETLGKMKPGADDNLFLNGPGASADPVEQAVHILVGTEDTPRGLEGVYRRIAEVSLRKGDVKTSLAATTKMTAIHATGPNLTNLAVLLEMDGQKDSAAKAYKAALLANPNNGVALNNLAFLMSENGGDLDEALAYAKQGEVLLKGASEAADTVGWIYLKKGNTDIAITKFAQAFRVSPANKSYRDHLSQAFAKTSNGSPAVEALQEALKSQNNAENQKKILELLDRLSPK